MRTTACLTCVDGHFRLRIAVESELGTPIDVRPGRQSHGRASRGSAGSVLDPLKQLITRNAQYSTDSERRNLAARSEIADLGAAEGQHLRSLCRVEQQCEHISLDLTDCDIDLRRLLDAGQSYTKGDGALTPEQLSAIESAVSDADGVFLPNWDDLEQHVNGARGGAGEVIADLRRRAEDARSSLLRSLGEGYLAHGNPEAATGALERALEHKPGDESVA